MPKRTRLGPRPTTQTSHAVETPDLHHDHHEIFSASYRGPAAPQDTSFSLRGFEHNKLIMENIDKIYKEFIEGMSQSSLSTVRKGIRFIDNFVTWLSVEYQHNISHTHDLSPDKIGRVYEFLQDKRSQYIKMKYLRRFLKALGYRDEDIPLNPYKEDTSKPKSTNTLPQQKSLISHFKGEAQIVIQRYDECQRLMQASHDSLASSRVSSQFWQKPENRMHALVHAVGLRLRTRASMRSEGLRGKTAGFDNLPGAMTLRGDGNHSRKTGLLGHLRWFYPCQRDLLPFVNLLQQRTNFTISMITGLTTRGIIFRDSQLSFYGHSDRLVQFSAIKFRTVNNGDGEPQYARATLLKKPWSYPYQLIEFLKKLRAPLAKEIRFSLRDLRASENPNHQEIARLTRIKDDLFLYHADGRINSLGEYADAGEVPVRFPRWMKSLGFDSDFSRPRNSGLLNGFLLSGGNQRILTLLGDHTSPRTRKYYLKRKEIKNKTHDLFNEYFGVSIALIDASSFSKENLKLLFYDKGFGVEATDNLLTDETRTHWGNNCATPTSPPPGFDRGTNSGGICVDQHCIDGCPSAVWFPKAVDIVIRKKAELEERRAKINFASSTIGFLNQHIARCEQIISELSKATT